MISFKEFLSENQQEMMKVRARIAELKRKASRSPSAREELEKAEEHLATLMKTSTL